MVEYKIKIFEQLSRKCCGEVRCEKHIQQEAIEEYSRRVTEFNLPNGEYYSQLYRVLIQNGETKEEVVQGVIEYPLISENHNIKIN